MALIFNDTFSVSASALLEDHVPDTGSSWTKAFDNTACIARVSVTACTVARSGGETAKSVGYTTAPSPTVNTYDIQMKFDAVYVPGTGTRTVHLFGRWSSSTDAGYAAQATNGNSASIGQRIIKNVSGVNTILASNSVSTSASDVMLFSIVSATKTMSINGASVLQTSDDTITATGQAGLGWGNLYGSGNIVTNWQIDNFSVTETDGAPAAVIPSPVMQAGFSGPI